MRSSDCSDVIGRTLLSAPPDPTDKEDSLHAELSQGRPNQALAIAHEIDVWLAAHLADIMVSLDLLEAETDEEYEVSHYFLRVAN